MSNFATPNEKINGANKRQSKPLADITNVFYHFKYSARFSSSTAKDVN